MPTTTTIAGEGRRRVLIVEDDPVAAEYYGAFLRDVFDTETVGTAEAMFNRLPKLPLINVVVLDMILPNGCGIAMLERLVKSYPQIPVLVATAKGISAEDALMVGVQEFVHKQDVSPAVLVEKVLHAIARSRVNRVFAKVDSQVAQMKEGLKEARTRMEASQTENNKTGRFSG